MNKTLGGMKAILALSAFFAFSSTVAASAEFDGSWRVTIKYSSRASVDPVCAGYLFPDPFHVKDSKISGTLRHDRRGIIFMSGVVEADGNFIAKAQGNAVDASVSGKLMVATGEGNWVENSTTFCDGAWVAKKIK